MTTTAALHCRIAVIHGDFAICIPDEAIRQANRRPELDPDSEPSASSVPVPKNVACLVRHAFSEGIQYVQELCANCI